MSRTNTERENEPARTGRREEGGRIEATTFRLGHCAELLAAILASPRYPADIAISRFFAERRYLGSHDRGFIAETIYAILRSALRYRWLLGCAALPPEREAATLISAAMMERGIGAGDDLLHDTLGIPKSRLVAIRETLGSARERIGALAEPERTAMACSVPVWFAARVIEEMGHEEGAALLASLGQPAPIALRANTLRTSREELIEALDARGIPCRPGRWAPDAVLLGRRMNANAIPEFKDGWFELQDEGSQMLSALLDPHPNWSVFDACAGAGGKALHMAAIMRGRGSVVAHDVNARRLAEIRPRLRRSGAQNLRTMSHEHYVERRASLEGQFDAVVIDAPCTGAGVLRRNPGAWLAFDEETVERMTLLQGEILREYSNLVKPGGLLLYATCSLLREENEEAIALFMSEHPGWSIAPPPVPAPLISAEGFFRAYPHRHGCDGFFGALLRRAKG